MKKCFKCGQEKQIDEFYKHPMMADGHLGKCKECTKKDVKENYNKNIEAIKKYEQERFKKPERKVKVVEYQKKRRLLYPEKYHAHNVVGNAIRDGKLKPEHCEVCGVCDVQAHHDDYNKPLDVRWLCFKHHRQLHGQVNV